MKRIIIMFTGLLLSSASVLAQGDKPTTSITPTTLPGEEKLSAQERAERDFLMPARRKQAAAVKAAAREEAATQTDTDVSAYHAEAVAEPKTPEAAAKASTPTAAPRHVTSRSRYRSTSTKKKVVHKSSASGKRKTATKSSSRRR
ncbi:hypothetical protein KBK19_06240 [Microvirga sp. STR05]|uniref:Uncharacterized protein n=1 Tax=Hymenobacter duratus TaxID=2771356 RepID=A0ABR8JG28_9BACT|nr:hypothetical protein [Hymenobacter duratus]MBD2714628.1 hypothetical protein [Hymenobacter duratus]MBR7949532.1 hypothetical protein [Microvirga sp. STR05]